MALRFLARSTTPGELRLTDAACALLFAEQRAVDEAAVLAKADVILLGETVLDQAGAFDLAAAQAAAAAGQRVVDEAAVDAGKADIKTTRTILGVAGTLNMGLYTLISGVVAPGFVLVGYDNYTGGAAGTFDEAARNTNPGAANVRAGTSFLIAGETIYGVLYVAAPPASTAGVASQFAAGIDQAMSGLAVTGAYTRASGGSPLSLAILFADPQYGVVVDVAAIAAGAWELMVRTSELAFSGSAYEPQIGDTIALSAGGRDYTYTVCLPDGRTYCWAWADKFMVRRKIFVKLIGDTAGS